jgi:hypothetical protein
VFIPSAESRLTKSPSYILGVYDEFNILHPLTDYTNTRDHVARFMPQQLSQWAPSIANKRMDEALTDIAEKIYKQEQEPIDKEALSELEKKEPTTLMILGLTGKKEHLKYLEEKAKTKPEARLNELIEELKKASDQTPQETREEVADADNVGIADDSGVINGR